MSSSTTWDDARRLEGWASETRVNLLRLIALVAFYGHHLLTVYLFQDDPALTAAYHTAVTGVVLAWAAAALALHLCLQRRWMPDWLKYAATGADLFLLTLLLCAGGEPRGVLASVYFLVIAAAALRLSFGLLYFATLGSMAGFLAVQAYARFWLELPAEQRLSRPQQYVVLLALGVAGLLAGQFVRQARRLVAGYPVVSVSSETR
jgi:hypothetical protein